MSDSLENRVSVTAPGSYSIIVSVDSGIYDHVELQMPERLLVLPKAVPWTASFNDKIYDGNSLLDGKTVTYRDVNGVSIPAALSAWTPPPPSPGLWPLVSMPLAQPSRTIITSGRPGKVKPTRSIPWSGFYQPLIGFMWAIPSKR